MRRSPLLLLIPTLMMVGGIAAACSCPSSLCDQPHERTRFEGELMEREGRLLSFVSDGEMIDVWVFEGRLNLLDIGRRYRVTAAEFDDGTLESHLNAGCGCREINITHPDGVRVDTGLWAQMNDAAPIKEALIALVALPAAVIAIFVILRLRRGPDGDPYEDMPYDEWVEF
jgi:hypothetical protein